MDEAGKRPHRRQASAHQKKLRLDDLLVERGFFADRDEALRAVLARKVRVGDVYPDSAAASVSRDAEISVCGCRRYVSRGGFKLEAALDAFSQKVSERSCIDIGSSTGGFTDCLLQAGAKSVACVDVNYGQLAWKIRQDARVTIHERTNIRTASPKQLGAPFDILVIDVSFIALSSLADRLAALSHPGSILIALVKPQFEARREENVRGIVYDRSVRLRTVDEVACALTKAGFSVDGLIESPLVGAKGNVEYLLHAVFSPLS